MGFGGVFVAGEERGSKESVQRSLQRTLPTPPSRQAFTADGTDGKMGK